MLKTKKVKETKDFDINNFTVESLPGVGPVKAKRMKENGVRTPWDIAVMGSLELSVECNMEKDEAKDLVKKVRDKLIEAGYMINKDSVETLKKHLAKRFHIPSGCKNLDDMMRGGLESQSLTEIYAPEGAGKTQYVNSLVVGCLSSGQGVYYIGCEGTIDFERLDELAEARGVKIDYDLLLLDEVTDTDQLEEIVDHTIGKIHDKGVKLIVIDGAVGLYRLENDRGRGQLNQRQNDIKPMLRHMRGIADYLNIAVLFTNQVMDNPDSGFGGDPIKAIGGHVVGHQVRYIIKFNKGGKNKRSATFVKSHKDALQNVEFYLNASGVSDTDIYEKPSEGMKEVDKKLAVDTQMIDKSLLLES